MREVEFRGIGLEDNMWHYGCLSYVDSRSQGIGKRFGDAFICQVQHSWQRQKEGYDIGWWIQVQTNTVGQYTGLKDKNGKKIYEGDIFNCIWSDAVGEPHFKVMKITDMTDYDFMAKLNYADEIEVIGNIYDNPELL